MNLRSAIIYFALTVVIVVACVGIFKVYQMRSDQGAGDGDASAKTGADESWSGSEHVHSLRLVSVFQRHADRGPNDGFPRGDRHKEVAHLLWPNGIANLTDVGRLRSYQIGQTLRRSYINLMDFKASQVLALSSPLPRCVETTELILKGLFAVDQNKRDGIEALEHYSQHPEDLPESAGFTNDWQHIQVDTHSVASLKYRDKFNCNYFRHYPAPMDSDLFLNPIIQTLPGIHQLADIIKARYGIEANYSMTGLWSTLSVELSIARTRATFNYTDHFRDWVDTPVKGGPVGLSLYDILEEVCVLTYWHRLDSLRGVLTLSPTMKSLVQAQLTALNRPVDEFPYGGRPDLYKNKRIVIYTSHDSVLQAILFSLGIIDTQDRSYSDRFTDLHKAPQRVQFLNGLRMSSMGLSFKFELWEMELNVTETRATKMVGQHSPEPKQNVTNLLPELGREQPMVAESTLEQTIPTSTQGSTLEPAKKRAYVGLKLYNEEDARFGRINYVPIEMGTICRKRMLAKYPNIKSEIEPLYLNMDPKMHCPFELFRNLTMRLVVDDYEWDQLC